MTLLQLMPAIAAKSQQRFASVFQSALLHAHELIIEDRAYFILFEREEPGSCKFDWEFSISLHDVVSMAKRFGKDCQILQLKENGTVIEL